MSHSSRAASRGAGAKRWVLLVIALAGACSADTQRDHVLPEAVSGGGAVEAPLTQDSLSARGALVAAAAGRFPEYRIRDVVAIEGVPGDFVAARMSFQSRTADWPVGTLLAVASADTSEIWLTEYRGDFGPHTFSWFDANQDGRTDLLVYGGEEDVFWTRLYVRTDSAPPSALTFAQVVYDSTQYLTVLDVGADGSVEYLGANGSLDSARAVDAEACGHYTWPDGIAASAGEALGRARRVPGVRIIDYNLPGAPQLMLHFPKPVAVWRLGPLGLVDVTPEYRTELRWHLDGVDAMRGKQDSPTCNATLERTAAYLRAVLTP